MYSNKTRQSNDSMHFDPPQNFRENPVIYTIYVQFFFEQKQWNACSVHYTMLFSTGYCSMQVYSQTHLHDLLVAHYTGNSKVQYSIAICEVITSNMATINVL